MVWGAIRSDGRRMLIRCDGNVDSAEYQRILTAALPKLYTGRHIFQHDGASCHTSVSTTAYLRAKQVRLLKNWPAQSPDLSIIENMWTILKNEVSKRSPKSCEELWRFAEEEWHRIPSKMIDTLYQSIPRRVTSVIRANGGSTRYESYIYTL